MHGQGKSYGKCMEYAGELAGGLPLHVYQKTQEEPDEAEALREGDVAGR